MVFRLIFPKKFLPLKLVERVFQCLSLYKANAKFELELETISIDVEASALDKDSVKVASIVNGYIAKKLQRKATAKISESS